MTRAALQFTLLFTFAQCLTWASVWGQMAGYAGGGYPPGPTSANVSRATQLPLYATRQTKFAIPFSVDRRIAQPLEVHLYVSTDQGQNWQLKSRQPPSASQFPFTATGDGEYWFASRTLGGVQPADSKESLQPELRVAVDTVKPQLEFTARIVEGGEILTTWQLFDENLLASSLKVEYQEGVSEPWKPVTIPLPKEDVVRTSYQGQSTWWPDSHSPTITVRAEVRDRAGNLSVVNRRLLLPALVVQPTRPGGGQLPQTVDPFARAPHHGAGSVPWPSESRPGMMMPGGSSNSLAQAPRPVGLSSTLPSPPPTNSPWGGVPGNRLATGNRATSRLPSTTPSADNRVPAQPASTQFPDDFASSASGSTAPSVSSIGPDLPPLPPDLDGMPRSADSGNSLLGNATSGNATSGTDVGDDFPVVLPHSSAAATPPLARPGASAPALPPGEHPQMTKSTRFHLAYDVDAVGPSGVAEVQLWATGDGGQTWRLWGTDDDLQSPFDVAVDEEGIFGFHVVVVGKNGMAGRRPRSGDLADIWVGVDTTAPHASLTSATYGEGHDTGKLLIRWEISDAHPDPRPVTLLFSETAEGPWTTIVSALPDSGQFAWPADPQLPPSVYLKLEVRDEAGNVAATQTSEPVHIDGLAPKARIRGIQPATDMDREAFRLPRRG